MRREAVNMFFNHSRKTAVFTVCLFLAVCLFSPLNIFAQEPEKKVVRVGWFDSAFCCLDQFGRRCGLAYEYQQKISAYTGWTYEYVEDSWPNLLELLTEGKIDLLSDVSYTEERSRSMYFSALPMGEEAYYVYIGANNQKISSEDITSFNGKTIGVIRGSVHETFLHDWAEKNKIAPVILPLTCGESESVNMLARGEIDAYATINTFGADERVVPVCRIGASEFFFAVSKKRPDLLNELNTALTGIQEEDPYYNQRLFDDHVNLTRTNAFLTPAQNAWLKEHGTIRIGYRDNYMPFCAEDRTAKELTGALRNFLAQASGSLKNSELNFEAVPYATTAEAFEAMKNHEVDCVFPVYLSTYDSEVMDVLTTNAFMNTEMHAVTRQEDSQGILYGRYITVAVNSESINYDTFLNEHFPTWQRKYYPDTESCLASVSSGENNCVLVSSYRISEIEKQSSKYKLCSVPTGEIMQFSFAVNRDDRELYFILNKTVILAKNEDMDSALASYASSRDKASLFEVLKENWLAVILFISVIFAVILILLLQKLQAERRAAERQKEIDRARIEHQKEHEETLRRELDQKKRLDTAMQMAYTDPLTGVKSKNAYVEAEQKMHRRILDRTVSAFAAVVFDLNDLKYINDTKGHEIGDEYIRAACRLIRTRFLHSPVFRIGGDEFVTILEGSDYEQRDALLDGFGQEMEENARRGGIVAAFGCSLFIPETDHSFREVFERADECMYRKKRELKEIRAESENRKADGNS